MTSIQLIGVALKKLDNVASKQFFAELKKIGGLTVSEEEELTTILSSKSESLIGDTFVRLEKAIKKSARVGVDIPKGIREYNLEELRLLDIQIEEGNSIAQLAEMRGISSSQMRKILEKYGRKTMEGTIADAITDKELKKLVDSGKSAKEIAQIYGLETSGALTPRLKKLGISATRSKINNIPEQYYREAFSSGKSVDEVAAQLKVSPKYIAQKYKELGLVKQVYTPTQAEINEIRDLVARDYTQSEISKKMGIEPWKVVKIVSENSIKTPRQALYDSLPRGAELEKHIQNSVTWADLATYLHCDETMAKTLLKNEGLTFTRRIMPKSNDLQQILSENPYATVDEIAQKLSLPPKLISKALERDYVKLGEHFSVRQLVEQNSPKQIAELTGSSTQSVIEELKLILKSPEKSSDSKYIESIENCLKSTKTNPTQKQFEKALERARKKLDKIEYITANSKTVKIVDELCNDLDISMPMLLRLFQKYNKSTIDYSMRCALYHHPLLSRFSDQPYYSAALVRMLDKCKAVDSGHVSEKYFISK